MSNVPENRRRVKESSGPPLRDAGIRLAALLPATAALASSAFAQVPPSSVELQAYAGLFAAAAGDDGGLVCPTGAAAHR